MNLFIEQNNKVKLLYTTKTIDWLTNNTTVSVFNPVSFEGYQRKIYESHVEKIVKFLVDSVENNDFFMPTSIITATNSQEYTDDIELRVVDGQHRIYAFKALKRNYPKEYMQIKDKQIPVAVMILDKSMEQIEIDTFITINKTSKRVDTSLAMVLKNKKVRKLNGYEKNLVSVKCEYIAVEAAIYLNEDEKSLWYSKISYEGTSKNEGFTISLNSFVKSLRVLISKMNKNGLIDLNWMTDENAHETLISIYSFVEYMWSEIRIKFNKLYLDNDYTVLQGAIGFSAFNKYIKDYLVDKANTIEHLKNLLKKDLSMMNFDFNEWKFGNFISKNSSLSGYKYVSEIINQSKSR